MKIYSIFQYKNDILVVLNLSHEMLPMACTQEFVNCFDGILEANLQKNFGKFYDISSTMCSVNMSLSIN